MNFMMFAFVTHETRLRPCSRAYSKPKRAIRSEASGEIGLIEIPELAAIWRGCIVFSVEITVRAASVPASYSIPAYRSSVFSRTITTSTFS